MKKKLKIIVPLALLLAFGAYKMVLAKPAEPAAKVHGDVYVLAKEFVLNLDDGRFARLGVGLVLEEGALSAGGHGAEAAPPPDGYGPLPQEALVRDIVTDALTASDPEALTDSAGRRRLKKKILETIHQKTDVHAEQVLFTDVAVQ
jgi:flagellar FliL protein